VAAFPHSVTYLVAVKMGYYIIPGASGNFFIAYNSETSADVSIAYFKTVEDVV
jgi:hypothetical protein